MIRSFRRLADHAFEGEIPAAHVHELQQQLPDLLQVQALAKAKPGAKVGLIGIGAPVPALKYLTSRQAFYAKKAGLKGGE